jgi:hypothetical protein
VEAVCAIDAAGKVSVTAEEKASGKQLKVAIERPSGLDKQQVESQAKLVGEYNVV